MDDDDLFGGESDDREDELDGPSDVNSDDGYSDVAHSDVETDDDAAVSASDDAMDVASDAGRGELDTNSGGARGALRVVSAARKREMEAAVAARQKAAMKLALKRIEKLAATARVVTEAKQKAATAARVQFRMGLEAAPRTPPPGHRTPPPGHRTPPQGHAGARPPVRAEPTRGEARRPARERQREPCLAMAESVGFAGDSFDARIAHSAAREFEIKRVVHTLKNRFAPFACGDGRGGPSLFYTDTGRFYSEPTELCCLWCTEPINGVPVPMPVRYRINRVDRDDWIFYVAGQYCNFSCMLAAYRQRPGSHLVNRSDQLARTLMWKAYGIPFATDVHPAPDPASLAKFGGIYTTEQFRSTGTAGVRTGVVALPFLPFSAGITEIESIDVTITEVGGQELAHRRLRSGFASAGLANPILNSQPRNAQRGKFATAPSIREQIEASDRRMRLQMQTLPQERKKKTLMDFMKKKE